MSRCRDRVAPGPGSTFQPTTEQGVYHDGFVTVRRLWTAIAAITLLGLPPAYRFHQGAPSQATDSRLRAVQAAPLVWVPAPTPTALRTPSRAASRSRSLLPKVPRHAHPSEAQWAKLRFCENGGRYTSKPGDQYRGAYQFDRSTWSSVGGSGDPADAPAAEQDARARILYADRGWHPWPVCGRWLR